MPPEPQKEKKKTWLGGLIETKPLDWDAEEQARERAQTEAYAKVRQDKIEFLEDQINLAKLRGAPPEKILKMEDSVQRLREAQYNNNSTIRIESKKSGQTFEDVAGIDEAVEECRDFVEYLRDPVAFGRLGGEVPKGILLSGPPGSGKTLLARAVAGEADVDFIAVSGSDFIAMLVGKGADNVRKLFAEAKKKQPCIIFIDEIDAVGKTRGVNSHDEQAQTLNALLVEMDGFEKSDGVIVMAATNRPETLDPALLRPGRFTRRVEVPYPDEKGRREILDIHLSGIVRAGSIDSAALAAAAHNFSGAMLKNLVNEAAIAATKAHKDGVDQRDLMTALEDEVLGGREFKSRKVSKALALRVAFHEAGHAVAILHGGQRTIHKATIVPRARSHGHVWSTPKTDDITLNFLKQDMVMTMAGRAAEEIHFNGDIGPGAGGGKGSDIDTATERAHAMVKEWGMSELGPVSFLGAQSTPHGVSPVAETTATAIDAAVHGLVRAAHADALTLLKPQKHWDEVVNVAKALLERGTLTGAEVAAAAAGTLPPLVPAAF